VATELRIEPVFDALKQPLGLIESDERRRTIETYVEAARLPLERAVYDLMSQLATSIDERVNEHYRIRLAYRPEGLGLEIEEKIHNGGEGGEEAQWTSMEGDVEKITIRIPAELKDLATQAAARAGTSANTWFIKALARAARNIEVQQSREQRHTVREERRGRGSRLSGWVGGEEE
jgi:hypothetical protein